MLMNLRGGGGAVGIGGSMQAENNFENVVALSNPFSLIYDFMFVTFVNLKILIEMITL